MRCEKSMNCKYCGNVLPEGAEFCTSCGAKQIVDQVAPVEPAVEAPVVPVEAIPVDGVVEAEAPVAFETPDFDAPPPKKKKKGKWWIAVVAVFAAAAVFVCYLYWGWFSLKLADLFGDDQDLRDKVIAQQTETVAEAMSAKYANAVENYKNILSGNQYATTTVELMVSDEVTSLASGLLSMADIDSSVIENLDGTYVTIAGGVNENVFQAAVQSGIGGTELVNMGMVVDVINQEMYVALPSLTDYYLDMSAEFSEAMGAIDAETLESVQALNTLVEALPSEEVVEELMKKYVAVALAELDDVSKEKEKVTVGDISQKMTLLTTSVSEEDLLNAVVAVLQEMQDDEDIEEMIVKLGDTIGELAEDPSITGDLLYDAFQEFTDDALDELGDVDASSGELFAFTQYLDGGYNIAGYALEVDGDEVLSCLTATKGKNFALEMEVDGVEVMSGEGTIKKGIVNGEFEVGAMGYGVTVKVSNFDKKAFEKGDLKGIFEIAPNAAMMDELMESMDVPAAFASMIDVGIKIDVDCTTNNKNLQLSITNGGEDLVGVKLSTAFTDDEVSVPDADYTMTDVEDWVETFDWSKLLAALSELGLTEDLMGGLLQSI